MGGFTFAEGMRLLAGADAAEEDSELESAEREKWSSRVAGSWFAEMLSGLSRAVVSVATAIAILRTSDGSDEPSMLNLAPARPW